MTNVENIYTLTPLQSGMLFPVLYDASGVKIGAIGVSGDGVDQDDVVTQAAGRGFLPAPQVRADMFFVNGVRLPYQKFNRNPEG